VHDQKRQDPLSAWTDEGIGIDQVVTSGGDVAYQIDLMDDEDDFVDLAISYVFECDRMRALS
jgi:hypothetical protein